MTGQSVPDLFRTAMANDDPGAMRAGLELLFGIADSAGLSSEAEYLLRRPDFVMDMPQSGERIRGRDAMRELQRRFPTAPPSIVLQRVVGSGKVWMAQALSDYGEDEPWHVLVVFELDDDALIARETRYYTRGFEAPEWRADLVEAIG